MALSQINSQAITVSKYTTSDYTFKSTTNNEPEIIERVLRLKSKSADFSQAARIADLNEEQVLRLARWTYFRLVEQADEQVGRLLDLLEKHGLADKTAIIFNADHGESNGHHNLRFKNHLYEEAVRVPLMIRPPGGCTGYWNEQDLCDISVDLFPTICEFAGLPIPPHCVGRSLVPLLEQATSEWRQHLMLECRYGRGVIFDGWKYCRYADSQHNELLFHLSSDPLEMVNLQNDPRANGQLEFGRKLLNEYMSACGEPALPRH